MRALLLLALLVVGSPGCDRDTPRTGESPRRVDDAGARPAPDPERAKVPDREEQRRRSEAVRRAAEELAARGVNTTDYLMNLIVEGEDYRVAFVKRSGRSLAASIKVRVRRDDLEVLGVEGLPDAGP